MKIKILIAVFSALLLATVGCSNNEEPKKDEVEKEIKQDQNNGSEDIKQNEVLTKQVKEEEGVLDGQVYEQDGMAIGTLVLGQEVSDEDAKKLSDKYADELKKEYKDMKVNVQAVRDGENVVNITKE